MRPQDRTRAILTSRLEPAMRLVLVAVADLMGEEDRCWPRVETVAERSGYCERQTRSLLNDAEARGLIRRWVGEHRTSDIVICWEALATSQAKSTERGGLRGGGKECPRSDQEGTKEGTRVDLACTETVPAGDPAEVAK